MTVPGAEPPRASREAQRIAEALGVDLRSVPGSGPGGRITRGDVEAAARGDAETGPQRPHPPAVAPPEPTAEPAADAPGADPEPPVPDDGAPAPRAEAPPILLPGAPAATEPDPSLLDPAPTGSVPPPVWTGTMVAERTVDVTRVLQHRGTIDPSRAPDDRTHLRDLVVAAAAAVTEGPVMLGVATPDHPEGLRVSLIDDTRWPAPEGAAAGIVVDTAGWDVDVLHLTTGTGWVLCIGRPRSGDGDPPRTRVTLTLTTTATPDVALLVRIAERFEDPEAVPR